MVVFCDFLVGRKVTNALSPVTKQGSWHVLHILYNKKLEQAGGGGGAILVTVAC